MKKIIFLAMLAISSVALTSCVNTDDGYYDAPDIVNVGQINYMGHSFPLRNAVVADIEQKDGGYYYGVEFSTNPVPVNGRLSGAYVYMKIFQRGDLKFNGTYVTENDDRGIDYIEYFEDPMMSNYEPITGSGSMNVYDEDFRSGSMFLENYFDNYNRSLLRSNFSLKDQNGNSLTGDFNGMYDFIEKYKKSAKVATSAKMSTERIKTDRKGNPTKSR